MAPHARNTNSLPPTGGAQLANEPPWGGPAEAVMAPHARKTNSLPPTGGCLPPWGGPAEAL
jgi:hypothetical protein